MGGPTINRESHMNHSSTLGNRFLRIAVLYFIAGIALGIGMAAHKEFTLRPVHAHVNLLGWVSLALFGLFYRLVPAASTSMLAKLHFWIYNIALPIQMVTLALYLQGNARLDPILGVTSISVAVAVICFAVNLWKYTTSKE
jgi:cbb3-type cytochrome oxidase subunit 1